jgi:hypothetical protein
MTSRLMVILRYHTISRTLWNSNLPALSVGLPPVVDPRNLVDLTPLSYIPGMRVVRYLGG